MTSGAGTTPVALRFNFGVKNGKMCLSPLSAPEAPYSDRATGMGRMGAQEALKVAEGLLTTLLCVHSH